MSGSRTERRPRAACPFLAALACLAPRGKSPPRVPRTARAGGATTTASYARVGYPTEAEGAGAQEGSRRPARVVAQLLVKATLTHRRTPRFPRARSDPPQPQRVFPPRVGFARRPKVPLPACHRPVDGPMPALLQCALWHRVGAPGRHRRRSRGCVACVTTHPGDWDRRYSCATPHSGYHFESQHRPWFEGWYGRVTLPGAGAADSFAMMYSIEDPLQTGTRSGVGAQVMGPGDEYIIQHSRGAVSNFWAAPHALELGATFRHTEGQPGTSGRPSPLISCTRTAAHAAEAPAWHTRLMPAWAQSCSSACASSSHVLGYVHQRRPASWTRPSLTTQSLRGSRSPRCGHRRVAAPLDPLPSCSRCQSLSLTLCRHYAGQAAG